MAPPGPPRVLLFDSGVGGLSVFDSIRASGIDLEVDYVADNAWLPYGLKSDEQLRARVPELVARACELWAPQAIVLACNTASTIALDVVRAAVSAPVVGVVPPVKPAAAATKTGVIGLLATPATVRRPYTDDLIGKFAQGRHVVRFGSAELVQAAERKLADEVPPAQAIQAAVAGLFEAPRGAEIDVVALACTHFPLLSAELAALAPRPCLWLDSGSAIARRLADVLSARAGTARARRAAFSDAAGALAMQRAFRARGFDDLYNASADAAFAPV